MAETGVRDNKLEWIDWMKAIGIYLVVLGHFYSFGEKFIYVFHVPLFFLISGFLSKREGETCKFWKKLWYNLAVPMLIMTVVNFVYACIAQFWEGIFDWLSLYWFVRNIAFGMVAGFDTLWFVYTLLLLKIIFQYCSSKKMFYDLTGVMLILAYVYNHLDLSRFPFFLNQPNAVIDVLTAFPFFALGVYVRDYKNHLNEWNQIVGIILAAVAGFLSVFACSRFNGSVELYNCCYGGNMFLFLCGGVFGSMMVFAISKLLGQPLHLVAVISRGTIIILGLHKLLINLVWQFFPASYWDAVFAAIIVVLFVPIIILTERYFPLMAGLYRINKK